MQHYWLPTWTRQTTFIYYSTTDDQLCRSINSLSNKSNNRRFYSALDTICCLYVNIPDVHDSYAWLTLVPSGHRMWRRRPSQAAACLGFSVEDSWNGREGGFQMSPFLPKENQAQRQSTDRGRVEIREVYLPYQLERTTQLCTWW
jgi:hypothetical protein